ncbi:MAG: zinc ABC transporter substrate-binding protein [Burkholderiales bacterium]
MPAIKIRAAAFAVLLFAHAHGALAHHIFACEPEWAALSEELGGPMVSVFSATTALQDPHRIEARPSLIARVRNADLLICTGLGIEDGWLPILIRESGNDRLQPGKPGYLIAGDYVEKLNLPKVLDRSLGDVHAQGNHHIQGDPRNILLVADELAGRLTRIDPAHQAYFQTRHKAFSERWREAIHRWEEQAAPLRGVGIVGHHEAWPYLCRWLGMREVAVMEPKPGIEPTIAHLQEVLATLQHAPANMIVRASYNNARASEWLAERTRLPAVVLPSTVGGTDGAKDLFSFYEDIIRRLLAAAGKS